MEEIINTRTLAIQFAKDAGLRPDVHYHYPEVIKMVRLWLTELYAEEEMAKANAYFEFGPCSPQRRQAANRAGLMLKNLTPGALRTIAAKALKKTAAGHV
jgi:hypothetical protein